MRKYIILAAMLPLVGCVSTGGKPEFKALDGGKVDPATYANARKLCNERYAGRYQTQDILYGPYKDHVGLIDDAHACMARHGVQVTGYRQKDGRLTRYPHSPKYLDY